MLTTSTGRPGQSLTVARPVLLRADGHVDGGWRILADVEPDITLVEDHALVTHLDGGGGEAGGAEEEDQEKDGDRKAEVEHDEN